jgi:type IV secretory pathway component VirB8
MNRAEIANLEHASRAAMAWIPEGADDVGRSRRLLAAIVPAATILAVAAMLLLAVL